MMISQKKIATTLALAVSVVQADNCGTWSKGTGATALSYSTHKFKATLTDKYCLSSAIAGATCGTDCCEKKDICLYKVGTKCAVDFYADPDKSGTATTDGTAKDDCCTAVATCDSKTCGTGWKDKAGKKDIKCTSKTCHNMECCDYETETCAGYVTAGHTCTATETHEYDDTKKDDNPFFMFDVECCKKKMTCKAQQMTPYMCAAGKGYDTSKDGSAVTDETTWKDTCCKTLDKCSSHTCTASKGWLKDDAKKDIECTVLGCVDAMCCKPDPDKCRGYTAVACTGDDGYNAQFEDSKAGTAVATDDEFKTSCCGKKATCDAAKAWTPPSEGTADGSPRQHEPVVALVLASIAAVAFRGM